MLPYNESLRYFPSFLQQLEMESNGKSVGVDGQPLAHVLNPIVWLGNNGQHAFLPASPSGWAIGALRFHRRRTFGLPLARTSGGAARQLFRTERGAGIRQTRG